MAFGPWCLLHDRAGDLDDYAVHALLAGMNVDRTRAARQVETDRLGVFVATVVTDRELA